MNSSPLFHTWKFEVTNTDSTGFAMDQKFRTTEWHYRTDIHVLFGKSVKPSKTSKGGVYECLSHLQVLFLGPLSLHYMDGVFRLYLGNSFILFMLSVCYGLVL